MVRAVMDFKGIPRLKFTSEWRQGESLCGEIKDMQMNLEEKRSLWRPAHTGVVGLKLLHGQFYPKGEIHPWPQAPERLCWLSTYKQLDSVPASLHWCCVSDSLARGRDLWPVLELADPSWFWLSPLTRSQFWVGMLLSISSTVGPTPFPSEWSDPASGGGNWGFPA